VENFPNNALDWAMNTENYLHPTEKKILSPKLHKSLIPRSYDERAKHFQFEEDNEIE
jgi:hypothetical protein